MKKSNKELKHIIQEGEGYKVEFKENLTDIDKTITAFSNSSGGKIYIGIKDNGDIRGIKITNKIKSQIQDIANNCDPNPKILLHELKNILIVEVRPGIDKPYKCSTGFYKRIGPNSQKLTRNEIIEIFKSEGKVRFDELVEPKFIYPKDFDNEKFYRFLELAGISRNVNKERLILSLGIAEKQEGKLYFNNTGILFFAKNPQQFVSWSVFTVALFKDKAGTDIIDRKEIKGGLFEIVEEVMKFVRLYAKVAYRFTGQPQRENIYEYPLDAVREAVINSVMHKYYFEHGHNNILRFLPDRIRIENYWQKPAQFILGETVFRRNHNIADLFAKIHFGEKMGTGFERIKQICQKENSPYPKVEFNNNYFYVIFKQSNEYLSFSDKGTTQKTTHKTTRKTTSKTTNKTAKKILNIIEKNPEITMEILAKLTNLTWSGVKYHLYKMKKQNIIKREGGRKQGYWKIT